MSEDMLAIPGFVHAGGRQIEAAALRKVLAHIGMVAPHTGQPFGEALLFGLGGGVGLGYVVYESGDYTALYLATRITTEESARPGFMLNICERLGVGATLQHSSSAPAAEKKLHQALAAGRPSIIWVDPRKLPFYGTPSAYHTTLAYGLDTATGRVRLADRCEPPIVITAAELAEARQGEGSIKFRALLLEPPGQPPDLAPAVREGIADCCAQMRAGFGPPNFASNFGLKSLEKWGTLLTSGKDKRGWPAFFPAGKRLFAALASASDQIENRGASGSAFRELYADFLDEAGAILCRPELAGVAGRFRESARQWGQLAAALLPDSIPLFRETRLLHERKRTLFEQQGRAANDEITLIDARLGEIRAYIAELFPLSAADVAALLEDLQERVLAIHQIEAGAVAELEQATGIDSWVV
jgi:hypothetical protein